MDLAATFCWVGWCVEGIAMQEREKFICSQFAGHSAWMCTPVQLLNVLEALEVEAQDARQGLDLHPLLRVLQAVALIAEELVVRVQRLHRTARISTSL